MRYLNSEGGKIANEKGVLEILCGGVSGGEGYRSSISMNHFGCI